MDDAGVKRVYVVSPIFTEEDKNLFKFVDPELTDPSEVTIGNDVNSPNNTLRLVKPIISGTDSMNNNNVDRYEDMNDGHQGEQNSHPKRQFVIKGSGHQRNTNNGTTFSDDPSVRRREREQEEEEERHLLVERQLSQRKQALRNNIPHLELIDSEDDDRHARSHVALDLEINEGKSVMMNKTRNKDSDLALRSEEYERDSLNDNQVIHNSNQRYNGGGVNNIDRETDEQEVYEEEEDEVEEEYVDDEYARDSLNVDNDTTNKHYFADNVKQFNINKPSQTKPRLVYEEHQALPSYNSTNAPQPANLIRPAPMMPLTNFGRIQGPPVNASPPMYRTAQMSQRVEASRGWDSGNVQDKRSNGQGLMVNAPPTALYQPDRALPEKDFIEENRRLATIPTKKTYRQVYSAKKRHYKENRIPPRASNVSSEELSQLYNNNNAEFNQERIQVQTQPIWGQGYDPSYLLQPYGVDNNGTVSGAIADDHHQRSGDVWTNANPLSKYPEQTSAEEMWQTRVESLGQQKSWADKRSAAGTSGSRPMKQLSREPLRNYTTQKGSAPYPRRPPHEIPPLPSPASLQGTGEQFRYQPSAPRRTVSQPTNQRMQGVTGETIHQIVTTEDGQRLDVGINLTVQSPRQPFLLPPSPQLAAINQPYPILHPVNSTSQNANQPSRYQNFQQDKNMINVQQNPNQYPYKITQPNSTAIRNLNNLNSYQNGQPSNYAQYQQPMYQRPMGAAGLGNPYAGVQPQYVQPGSNGNYVPSLNSPSFPSQGSPVSYPAVHGNYGYNNSNVREGGYLTQQNQNIMRYANNQQQPTGIQPHRATNQAVMPAYVGQPNKTFQGQCGDYQPMASGQQASNTNPYQILPPVEKTDLISQQDAGNLRFGINQDSKSSTERQLQQQFAAINSSPRPNAGGSYLEQYQRQKKKQPADYKEYTLEDYRKLQKELKHANLGTLGPDMESEELREKREKALRQAEYAREIKKRHNDVIQQRQTREREGQADKDKSNEHPSDNTIEKTMMRGGNDEGKRERKVSVIGAGGEAMKELAEKRKIALEYAKNVPKPKMVTPSGTTAEANSQEKTSSTNGVLKGAVNRATGRGADESTKGKNSGATKAQAIGGKAAAPLDDVIDSDELLRLHQRHEQEKQSVALLLRT